MILYQDEYLLAFDKPSGMLVHRGWDRDKVVAMTLARDHVGKHVHPVHRLDRGTSGVVLFALDKDILRAFQKQFAEGTVQKRYLALVRGIPPERGVIDHPIPRTKDGERVPAVTDYERLLTMDWEAAPRYALLEARPQTGRLHQVRRHLKHLNHPLIGDVKYGKGEHNRRFREHFGLHRLALHAWELHCTHPVDGRPLAFRSPLPGDLAQPFQRMGWSDALYEIGLMKRSQP